MRRPEKSIFLDATHHLRVRIPVRRTNTAPHLNKLSVHGSYDRVFGRRKTLG